MRFVAQNCFRTVGGTALSGVVLGFTLALAYGFTFVVYAIVRSSLQIVAILSPGEALVGTLLANAFALFVPALVFALLCGLGAALLQSITLLLVHGVAALINPHHAPALMAGIGLISASLLAGASQVAVQQSLGIYFDALWPSGYLFWLGLPSLLFIGATIWVSWRLSNHAAGKRMYARLS